MDELNCGAKAAGAGAIDVKQECRLNGKERAETFAAAKYAVAHRIIKMIFREISLGEQAPECAVNRIGAFVHSSLEFGAGFSGGWHGLLAFS